MRIAILYASAGHGHQKAAEAVREGFLACGVPKEEILVLDALGETPAWFRTLYTSIYYYSVKHTPWAWGWTYDFYDRPLIYERLAQPVRRWGNAWVGKRLVERIRQEKPEAILFTHFFAPELLGGEKARGALKALTVTVVTDFLPHSFWINPGTDHYWVMSEEGKKILEERGIPSDKITSGGIPISLKFKPEGRKIQLRQKERLEENRFTLLITSGSFGLGPTEELLRHLREFGDRIQVIVVCGRNETLRQRLEKQGYPFRLRLYGFVDNMNELMEASDLLIAKPGGATTTESLAKEIPMVIMDPIPGQEAGNTKLLQENNASFLLGQPSDIRVILKAILDYPEVLEEKKRSIRRLAKPEAAVSLARLVLETLGTRGR